MSIESSRKTIPIISQGRRRPSVEVVRSESAPTMGFVRIEARAPIPEMRIKVFV
jgi:hypothetical protein